MAPLLLNREETNDIFRILNFKVFEAGLFSNEFLIGINSITLSYIFYYLTSCINQIYIIFYRKNKENNI